MNITWWDRVSSEHIFPFISEKVLLLKMSCRLWRKRVHIGAEIRSPKDHLIHFFWQPCSFLQFSEIDHLLQKAKHPLGEWNMPYHGVCRPKMYMSCKTCLERGNDSKIDMTSVMSCQKIKYSWCWKCEIKQNIWTFSRQFVPVKII